MLKGLLIFATGVYGGIYACQNYDVPRVDDPQKILEKVQEFIESYKKKP